MVTTAILWHVFVSVHRNLSDHPVVSVPCSNFHNFGISYTQLMIMIEVLV